MYKDTKVVLQLYERFTKIQRPPGSFTVQLYDRCTYVQMPKQLYDRNTDTENRSKFV